MQGIGVSLTKYPVNSIVYLHIYKPMYIKLALKYVRNMGFVD